MRVNSNYASFITGFSAARYYEAADGGQFNAEEFGASVLAYPPATFLADTSAAAPVEEQWWGNLDVGGTNGWSIGIAPVGDAPTQLAVVGKIGTGSAIVTLQYVLSNASRAAWVERMMHVQLWVQDGVGYLAINGNIVARADVAAYGSSANAPTLGAGVGGARPALQTMLGGASYAAGDIGGAAAAIGAAWRAATAGMRDGYMFDTVGADWVHRYDINESMLLGASGAITKSAAGAVLSVQPRPPTSLADLGNQGPTVLDAGATAVALAFVGSLTAMAVFQLENPEWCGAGGIAFGSGDGSDLSFLGITVITATNAVWEVPADTTFIEYEVIGGGGGGGGVGGDAGEAGAGGGGGSGGYTRGTMAVVPGSTLALAIGAAGAAGAAAAGTGGTGGVSSINTPAITALGGEGGVGSASTATVGTTTAGGAGGAAGVGGSYMRAGQPGAAGIAIGAAIAAASGSGGPSHIAGGGLGLALGNAGAATAGNNAANNSGAGGGGAAACADGDVAGGAGGSGVIIFHRYGP